jgi:hypothetical protein
VDRCVNGLRDTGHTVSLTEVLAVEIPDQPGGLAGVLEKLSAANLNVEYMYAFVCRATEKAMVVFRFEAIDEAIVALQKAGISIVPAEKVYTL